MDEYESMINDESVKCALTKEQFKEVKALRALSFYHGLCETYDTHKHYYLTQADKDTRVFMYVIAGITTYTEMLYAKFCDKLYQCTS